LPDTGELGYGSVFLPQSLEFGGQLVTAEKDIDSSRRTTGAEELNQELFFRPQYPALEMETG